MRVRESRFGAAAVALFLFSACDTGNSPGSDPEVVRRSALVGSALTAHQPEIRWQGRSQSIDADPADPNFAIVATENGGAFRTTNGGDTWTRLDNLPPNLIFDLRICPTNHQIVMVGARVGTGTSLAFDPGGIWRSGDGGDTWTRPTIDNVSQSPYEGYGIAFQPGTNCGTVYVGTSFGLAQCTNSGQTCTNIPIPTPGGNDIASALTVQSNGTVDAHTFNGHRRYDGTTWSPVRNPAGVGGTPKGLPSAGYGFTHSMAISPFNPQVLLAASRELVPDPANPGSLMLGPFAEAYESDDGGANWTPLKLPRKDLNGRPFFAFAVPSRSGVANEFDFYLGDTIDVFRQTCTENGGTAPRCAVTGPNSDPWKLISLRQTPACGKISNPACPHQDPSDMFFDATTHCPIYLAGDGGVLKVAAGRPTASCGQSGDWFTQGSLPALEIFEVTGQVHPSGAPLRTELFFSTIDNDIWASASGGDTWDGNIEAEGGGLQIPHSAPDPSSTLLTGYTCAGCFNFQGTSGFATTKPLGWPDSFGRRVDGNRKDRVLFSCPDGDKDGVCDRCIDDVAPLGECDTGANGVPCQDANGLALTFPTGTPLPVCAGVPCVDAVNNVGGSGADGLCDWIGGIAFQGAHVPFALPDGRWLQWDGGALSAKDADPSAKPPVSKVLRPSQLWLSDATQTTWTAVPGVALGTVGADESATETANWTGLVARGPGNTLVLYQQTIAFPPNGAPGLRRVNDVLGPSPTFVRADVGLTPTELGFFGYGPNFPDVAVDPSNSARLLAVSAGGYFVRSNQSGDSWVTDAGTVQLATLVTAGGRLAFKFAVSSMEFDGTNPNRILVGTREGGIISTLDGGQTWARLCGTDRVPQFTKFFFDEVEHRVYASSFGRGIWIVDPTQQQVPSFSAPPPNVTVFDCGPVNIGQAQASDQCTINPSPVTVTAAVNAAPGDPDDGCQTGARPCGNFQRGARTVVWTAVDQYGDAATTTSTVTVDDRTPPVISPVANITVVACAAAGEAIQLQVPTAVDRCVGPVSVTGQVIASTTATVPRTVTNGQVVLPAGVHTVRWTASDGITSSSVTQIVTVRPGIFANRDLELRDRARTTLSSGAPAAISNRGTLLTQIGSDATAGDILSVARVDMRDRAHVVGGITTQSTLTRGNQTTVTGTIRTNTPVALPPFPSLAGVVFPPPTGTDLFVNPGSPVTLAPGSYRNVTVNTGGTLQLSTGDYFFLGLTINSSATVRTNDSAGPTRVFIANTFAYRSRFQRNSGALADVFVGYRGTPGVVIEAPFLGTLIAPSATVELGTATVREVRARIAALNLIVRPDTNLICASSFAPTL